MTTPTTDWAEEFSAKFGSGDESGDFPSAAIKTFIRNLLTQQKEEIRGAIGSKRYGGVVGQPYSDGYNEAIHDVLAALDTTKNI